MRFSILLILSICCIQPYAQAQYWEFGAAAGITNYHGDLAPDFSLQAPGVAVNAFARYNIDSRLCFRIGAAVGTMSASDANSNNAYQQARNLSFKSDVFEGSAVFEFNFLPYHHRTRKGRNGDGTFTPYMVAGVGVFRFNPKAKYKESYYPLQPLGTEGQDIGSEYSLIQGNLIIGGGFKIDIGKRVSLNIEGATRILFTDYLDDVGGTYANARVVAGQRGSLGVVAAALADRSLEIENATRLGSEGKQRGDSKTNDGYTMFTIGIHYTVYDLECPAYSFNY